MILYLICGVLAVASVVLGALLVRSSKRLSAASESDTEARKRLSDLESRFGPILDVEVERQRAAAVLTTLQDEVHRTRTTATAEAATFERQAAEKRAALDAELRRSRDAWDQKYGVALAELEALTRQVEIFRDESELQALGFYKPLFSFDTSARYKEELDRIRDQQAAMLKDKMAAVCSTEWTVEGSKAKGKQMVDRTLRLMLRAFNGECDASVARVRYNNVNQMIERITRSFEAINKLGEPTRCALMNDYRDLKIKEVQVTNEYADKQWQEKEEQRRIREEQREQELAEREVERAQREAEKEEAYFAKALEKARAELSKASETKQFALREQIAELERQVATAHEAMERAKSMAEMTKRGHVYVISNEGSFGEQVYKIGMTRRLDPLDRVRELGDASVPFLFDVHAVIYSEDAPSLEGKLHAALAEHRVNLVNFRKEFFRVSLAEVEKIVHENHGAIEFTRVAEAAEYRRTLALRQERSSRPPAPTDVAEQVVEDARRHFSEVRTRLMS